jgi:HD-GYP domain-containing protein (c-di-GMP phosphodiesterase class II)
MRNISIDDLKAGTFVERHLYFRDNFIVFPKYLVLTAEDLERAKRFNLVSLAFDDRENPAAATAVSDGKKTFAAAPGLEGLLDEGEVTLADKGTGGALPAVKLPSPPPAQPAASPVSTSQSASPPRSSVQAAAKPPAQGSEITIYGSIVSLLSKELMKVRLGEKIEISKIFKIASIIIEYVSNVREEAILHVARGREKSRIEVHSVNVGILSSVLGLSIKMKGVDLINIVTGAVLHDVGILLIQDRLSEDSGNLEIIKDHTWQGFRYLKSIKNLDPASVMPALQHHERAGGDGYPQRIPLSEMEYASRLVSLCDSFDNQISFIKYGNDLSIHFTKNEFVTWKKDDFDQELFTASIRVMGEIFKHHSPVILNDGNLALIKEVSIRFPFSPVVQVIADEKGNKTAEMKTVDTRKSRDVWISRFLKKNP